MSGEYILSSPQCSCIGKQLKKNIIDLIVERGLTVMIGGQAYEVNDKDIQIKSKQYNAKEDKTTYFYQVKVNLAAPVHKYMPQEVKIEPQVEAPAVAKGPSITLKVEEAAKNVGKASAKVGLKGGRLVRLQAQEAH